MFIYSVIFILLIFGVFHYDYRKKLFLDKFYYLFIFVIMTVMTALRYRVGGDSLGYEDTYQYLPKLSDFQQYLVKGNFLQYQPLYILFTSLCKEVTKEYYFYQIAHSITVNVVLFWFIQKYSKSKYIVLFILYIFLFYFYYTFEIQREILAICCFLLAYRFYEKNNWLVYYAFAFLAFFFHISATLLFILPLFKLIRFTKKFIIFSILITLPLIFFKDVFYNFIKDFFITEAMESKGDAYSKLGFSLVGVIVFYFVRVVLILPFLFISLKNSNSKQWLLSGFLILSILSQTVIGLDRWLNYLYIPYIIYIVDQIRSKFEDVEVSRFRRSFVTFTIILNLFFVLSYKVILDLNVTDRARYQAVFFPYGDIFQHEKHIERENFMRELWLR